jgi:hypothetical protein
MTIAVASPPTGDVTSRLRGEPPLWAIVLIFWAAFAVAVVSTGILNPHLFESQDPDAFLRLVQVRDLLAGQGWFDLVQHRGSPGGRYSMVTPDRRADCRADSAGQPLGRWRALRADGLADCSFSA